MRNILKNLFVIFFTFVFLTLVLEGIFRLAREEDALKLGEKAKARMLKKYKEEGW